jgi:hypothetical protein
VNQNQHVTDMSSAERHHLLSAATTPLWIAPWLLALLSMTIGAMLQAQGEQVLSRTYFVDSTGGADASDGLSEETAWRSLSKLKAMEFIPGDTIRFKRGSRFSGALTITDSGSPERYIVLTDYGDAQSSPPAFTCAEFDSQAGRFGNCIRLKGSFILVENLYFHDTVAELSGKIGFEIMWELGALYVDRTARHCVIRSNEFVNCGVGIKSYGEGARIQGNFLHDCNRVLKKWNWGPIGIWLGADDQEVCHNRIVNYRAVDPRINWGPNGYGSGADGGAIEIDDARNGKSSISIHHNFSRDNQGFVEVTWSDLAKNPNYTGFQIHHNVSDDFQQFIALWRGAGCRIENNTIIRRKVNANDWGVFNITHYDSRNLVRNNIVVVEQGVMIFNLGKEGRVRAGTVIQNNLYFAAAGNLNMGLEGPGEGGIIADPKLVNYRKGVESSDFALTAASPAIDRGLPLGYRMDHRGVAIPVNRIPDLGAFEYLSPNDE